MPIAYIGLVVNIGNSKGSKSCSRADSTGGLCYWGCGIRSERPGQETGVESGSHVR